MKALPQLLSCLLVVSVSLPNSGEAWSATPSGKSLSKSSAKAPVKRARLANGKAKRPIKSEQSTVVAAAPAGASEPPVEKKVASAPLPSSSTTSVASVTPPVAQVVKHDAPPAKVNPYLPGAIAMAAPVNPYLPVPATPSAWAKAPETAFAVAAASKVDPAPAIATAPVVVLAAPESASQPPAPASREEDIASASARAWAKIVAGPTAAPVLAPISVAAPTAAVATPAGNPYLGYRMAYNPPASPTTFNSVTDSGQLLGSLRNLLPEPHLPSADIDILPSITKVYPTGERPMYVLTFKCPTELVGITPPPTKALRWLITSGMDSINSTNLLPFSMQQVCQ